MKKEDRPKTNVKKPEPSDYNTNDWIIWAAWADRITFEEIYEKTKTPNCLPTNKPSTIPSGTLSSKISKDKAILKENLNFKTAKNITHDLVNESVNSRAVSDVPIGTFLSGGVDSSIVSLCLSKDRATAIDTFSVGFQKNHLTKQLNLN